MDANRYSVVIPTYNRLTLLKDALRSLEQQTIKPTEVIIVDDGSSDGTYEFCSDLTQASPRSLDISYHRTKNSGVSAARNLGASHASSDRLVFLDSDDVWLPRMGETLLKALSLWPGVSWVFSNFIQTRQDLRPLPGINGFKRAYPAFASTNEDPFDFFRRHLTAAEFESSDLRIKCFYGDFFPLLFLGNFVQPSGVMIRKAAFLGAGGFDPSIRYGEETEFFHRFAARQKGMVLLRPSYLWRMGSPNSLSNFNTIPLVEAALKSHSRARGMRELDPMCEVLSRRGYAVLYHTYLLILITRGQNRSARRFIARSFCRDRYFTRRTAFYWLASLIPSRLIMSARAIKRKLKSAASDSRRHASATEW